MKDQYFGDINDYRKYGLLRSLQASTNLDLLVGWMLTPNDDRRDGEMRSYLRDPPGWKCFDPVLYLGLASLLAQSTTRGVSLIESASLIPRTSFFSRPVPDDRDARKDWCSELLAAAAKADLVFLDPDNGIEVASRPIGRKDSSKYLAWHELDDLWSAGCSLLIYQHYPREARHEFVRALLSKLKSRTRAGLGAAFTTAHVVFVLLAQPRHEAVLEGAVQHVASSAWVGQISVVRPSAG